MILSSWVVLGYIVVVGCVGDIEFVGCVGDGMELCKNWRCKGRGVILWELIGKRGVESVIFYSVDMRYLCECYGDG